MTSCAQDADSRVGQLTSVQALEPYSSTEVLVVGDVDRLAREYHTHVTQPLGAAGVGGLAVPEGRGVREFLWELRQDSVEAWPMGLMSGAGTGDYAQYQWHLQKIKVEDDYYTQARPTTSKWPLATVTVAVVDSGVSETSGLQWSSRSASLDLVDDDTDVTDGHGHGTHIASIVAGWGQTYGVAPGVTLVPVRVLDDDNAGVEADLINGIQHAVDSR